MKKYLSILLSVLLTFSVCTSITAFASMIDWETGFHFDKEANEIVITDDKANDTDRIYELDGITGDADFFGLNVTDGVTVIGEDIMAGCDKLTHVKIPKTVTKIRKGAFSDCDNLKMIYFEGTKTQWKQIKIEREGNEDFLDADVIYGEKEEVNNIPAIIGISAVVLLSVALTLLATKKRKN